MAKNIIDLDPLEHITADAIGQPGSRVFYLQGWRKGDLKPVTIIIEKIQLYKLALGIKQMLDELFKDKPITSMPHEKRESSKMSIHPPVDPLFRAGEIGLGYDSGRKLIIIEVHELLPDEVDEAEASIVRFWCDPDQALYLSVWADEVINRGRPLCPQCGAPMEPEGHFCPKKNGNKKK